MFSPRATLAHHIGDNEATAMVADPQRLVEHVFDGLYPRTSSARHAAIARRRPGTCVREMERCAKTGIVGANLNPDPSGPDRAAAPRPTLVPDLREDVRVDIPGDGPVPTSCNPSFHATGAHYLNADTTAFTQRLQGDLSKDFPTLCLTIPHGGGAVPHHWGRFASSVQELKRPPSTEHVLPTCTSTPASITSPASTCSPVSGGEHCSTRNDGRLRGSTRHRTLLRRHQALHRGRRSASADDRHQIYEATRAACIRGWMRH
ncbi:MAG: amidohydrolase family protein [Betaproteobacteria bacterium]|nr:amidohydrolase family protein [Betaproteobacteria bacterium]